MHSMSVFQGLFFYTLNEQTMHNLEQLTYKELLKMEEVLPSELCVTIYQSTRRNIPHNCTHWSS